MARPVEHGDDHVLDRLVLGLRERADVLADRASQVDDANPFWSRDDLLHVEEVLGVVHGAAVGHGDDAQCVLASGSGQARSIDRVDRDVAVWPLPVPDLLAVEEHRGFVLFALADDNNTGEVDRGEELAHGVDGGAVGSVLVTTPDERRRPNGSGLGCAHQLHSEVSVRVRKELPVLRSRSGGR